MQDHASIFALEMTRSKSEVKDYVMITADYSGPKYGPEYAKGQHEFTSHEEFERWYSRIKRPGINVGAALCILAERGSLSTGKVEAHSDFFIKDYSVRMELEERTGVIKWKGGGHQPSNAPGAARACAKELDMLQVKGGNP